MRELEARERFLTADEDMLRAEHVGESTLQVKHEIWGDLNEISMRFGWNLL